MTIKPFYLVVAALLAVALAIGIFAARPPAQSVVAPPPDRPKIITVHAQGSMAIIPAGVDMVAELWATGKTATDASAALLKADKALREALVKARITDGQFQLGVSYPDPSAPVPTQGQASSAVRVYERLLIGGLEPKVAFKAMEVIGSHGWWSGVVRYVLKDEDRAIQQATEKAMKIARDQAYATANVGGMKIKGVRSVTIDPRGAVWGPDPMTGQAVKEGQGQAGSAGAQPGTSAGAVTTPPLPAGLQAYPILWHPTLPSLNADGTVTISVSITAEFDF
ncbi:MAG: SIMPL domain-containing protein [Bacillota bacterium]